VSVLSVLTAPSCTHTCNTNTKHTPEFIQLLSSEANELSSKDNKSTITPGEAARLNEWDNLLQRSRRQPPHVKP
jgi:hypothetical protein